MKNVIKYVVSIVVLFSLLLFANIFLIPKKEKNEDVFNKNEITIENIVDSNEDYVIDVKYPRFNKDEITDKVLDYLYNYIKEFKTKTKGLINNSLTINYELFVKNNIINVFFTIDDSLNSNNKYKSIFIDLQTYKETNIVSLYDKEYLRNAINELVDIKYRSDIRSVINNKDLSEFEYKITDDGILVYFNKKLFEMDLSYVPFVYIGFSKNTLPDNRLIDSSKKLVAFTFDDGPGAYTIDLVKVLKIYDCSATFFMLGNRMKYNQESVKYVFDNGLEIGSHTYAHKILPNLTDKNILEEINSTTVIFNEITGSNITLLRPPYGSYDGRVLRLSNFPIITWNIDTKDWLYKDPQKTYEHVLDNATDGSIILMHEVYSETIEAVKMLIPELITRGYEIVSVSELANLNGITLEANHAYRNFN